MRNVFSLSQGEAGRDGPDGEQGPTGPVVRIHLLFLSCIIVAMRIENCVPQLLGYHNTARAV